jgi:hypothetical protein
VKKTFLKPNPLLQRVLNEMEVQCRYANCRTVAFARDIAAHEKECAYARGPQRAESPKGAICSRALVAHADVPARRAFPCYNDCGTRITPQSEEKHLQVCPKVPIDCPNGCGVSMERSSLNQHNETCSEVILPCRLCGKLVRRKAMDSHNAESLHSHIETLATKVEVLQAMNIPLSTRIRRVLAKDFFIQCVLVYFLFFLTYYFGTTIYRSFWLTPFILLVHRICIAPYLAGRPKKERDQLWLLFAGACVCVCYAFQNLFWSPLAMGVFLPLFLYGFIVKFTKQACRPCP